MKIFKKSAEHIFTLLMSMSMLVSCSAATEKKDEEKRTYAGTRARSV